MRTVEIPEINKYFEMVGGDSKEGYVESHQVISILTRFHTEWLQYTRDSIEKSLVTATELTEANEKIRDIGEIILR